MVSLPVAEPTVLNAVGLTRSFDATVINRIINDPAIFPLVALPNSGPIDLGPALSDPRHVLLMQGDVGGFLFLQDEPGIYEVHTNFLPAHRGRLVVQAAHAAAKWMFTHTDAMILQTRIPVFNRPALAAIKYCGFSFSFSRPQAWPTKDGMVDVKFYRRSYESWVESAGDLAVVGERFHDRLDREYERHGKPAHTHPADEAHDRYVGACFETIEAGQPEKAVILYNRWARFSGYDQIQIASRSPLILDITEALLMLTGDTFKVIKCR